MTPFELLAAIEDADVRARRGKRRIILELRAPIVMGQKGAYLGVDPPRPASPGDLGDLGGPRFGYTRRQCFAIRDTIYAAAREDLGDVE